MRKILQHISVGMHLFVQGKFSALSYKSRKEIEGAASVWHLIWLREKLGTPQSA